MPTDLPTSAVRNASDPIQRAHDNWTAAGWGDAADGMALVTTIMRVQQLYLGRVEAVLRPHGLTFARYEVLRLLAFSRRGELPVGKVGERLQVHPASVTNAMQRLEEADLVARRPNPADGRSVLAAITPAGRRLVDRCTDLLNGEVFADTGLTDGELERARASLDAVRATFGDGLP